jgi:general secretion pathway protein D
MRAISLSRLISLLLSSVLISALVFAGQQPKRDEFVSLDLDGVDLATLTKHISEISGRIILFDPNVVKGKVTVVAPGKIPKEEVWSLFQAILEVHGYTTVSAGSVVKIIRAAEAKTEGIEVRKGTGLDQPPARDVVITQVVPLKYARAQDLANTLTPLLSPQGRIAAYQPINVLIITDYASNVARLVTLITGKDDAPKSQ